MLDSRFTTHLRYACRRLAKSPGFSATAILSLALGIGATTAIFSLVNAVLLRPMPVRAPEEVVEIYQSTPDYQYSVFSYPDYRDLRDATQGVFTGVVASRLVPTQMDGEGGVEPLVGELVSGNYFPLLGIEAYMGRTLLPEDDVTPGGHPVVMVSYDAWQKQLAADPQVLGRELRLGGRVYTIVGVAPPEYTGAQRALAPAIFAPMMMVNELMPGDSDNLEARGNHSIFVKGRLAPGVPLARAQGVADGLAARLLEADTEDWDPQTSFLFVPHSEVIIFPPMDRFLRAGSWLLMVVVGLVLLMACTNLASFLLARSLDRRKEIALRLVLGANRRSLAGQMVSETMLLSLLGGVAGLGLAVFLLRLLTQADLPLPLPINLDLMPDAKVLAFSLGVSVLAGLLLGLAPILQNLRGDLAPTLQGETAGSGQGGKLKLRNALVVAQVAISMLLLLAAGLFLRSMQSIQTVDPGFGHQPSALLNFLVPATRFDEASGRAVVERLVADIAALPGVQAVGLTDNLHLTVTNTQGIEFNVDGLEPPPGRDGHGADRATIDDGFLAAVGIEIVEGRNFDSRDQPDGQPVAIVSQALVQKMWPSASANGRSSGALGKMLRSTGGGEDDLLIVGVAADAKVRSLGEAPRPFVYLPYSQDYTSYLTAVAQTAVDPSATALQMMQTARRLESDLFVMETETMERHLGIVLLPARLSAVVLGAFAALALTLAAVGLYGIVRYAVVQRRREVGIRISMGADSKSVVGLMMSSGLKLVALGSAIGVVLALVVSRLLSSLLFGVEAADPMTFVLVPALLLLVSALAALLPALAASRVDPATVLRAE